MTEELSPRPPIKRLFHDFAGYTTLHGLHYVFDSGSYIRRSIWLILILVGLGFCVGELIISYGKLSSYDYVLSKEISQSDAQTFPAVTICNKNMMKRCKIKDTNAKKYLDELNFLEMIQPNKTSLKSNFSNFELKKAVDAYGHKIKDMIVSCSWNGEECSYLNFTKRYSYAVSIRQSLLLMLMMVYVDDDDYYY